MNKPLLELYVEEKSFEHSLVLDNVSLRLHAGEVLSLLGPSGCGKSTVLRIIAGLERNYTGHLHTEAGRAAFIFQEPRLMPWLTVEQNIGFSDDQHYDRAWVAQLIDEVGLTGFAQALPKQLSGGMAQRVAIARGLYSRAQVLLLDEPFSAVDTFTRFKLQDLLLELAERHACALLLVTHDVDEALYLSDRVLVMGNRPSRIRLQVEVPLPRPRNRSDLTLATLKEQVLGELHAAHVI